MEEKRLSEQESLKIISEMIQKAKSDFHSSGNSAILWGTTIAICGFVNFAELYWKFYIGFDIWWLTFIALITQIIITSRHNKQKKVVTHTEIALNSIWTVYAISIFALIVYMNIVPHVTDRLLSADGTKIIKLTADGATTSFHFFIPSNNSLFLLLYAIPTLATGLICKFKPMIYASVLCYIFFIISCFATSTYDVVLNGMAGIFNWLIPGLILRNKYYRQKKAGNV